LVPREFQGVNACEVLLGIITEKKTTTTTTTITIQISTTKKINSVETNGDCFFVKKAINILLDAVNNNAYEPVLERTIHIRTKKRSNQKEMNKLSYN